MPIVEIRITPEELRDFSRIQALACEAAGAAVSTPVQVVRRSLDCRGRRPRYVLRVQVGDLPVVEPSRAFAPKPATGAPVLIVGAGPGGYFAALGLLEAGFRPIVLERGRDVRSRRRDLKPLYTQGRVDPHSNYCFGEGGAGAYSDGKLYTRVSKRGDPRRVLRLLVEFGASPDILVDAHPHLGSNVLPRIVAAVREAICALGGEVHFGAHVTGLVRRGDAVCGVRLADGSTLEGGGVVLAPGHSARDVFAFLHAHDIAVEPKPFALGVRIEHPQALVDRMFYGASPRHPGLPPASYRLTHQAKERGVFSFCMCPGGFIVPAATAPGELVLNGMSLAARSAPFANAGIVAEVRFTDVPGVDADPLAMLRFQAEVEQAMFAAGDGTLKAPAQRVPDFLRGVTGAHPGRSSYVPGCFAAPLHELLPPFVTAALREALRAWERRFPGFASSEAKILAVESRTSSPVRIPRDAATQMHPAAPGLFPCGEGAGYAGGIVSAALDGLAAAQAVARYLKK
ncbi:MAG: dependent oxidoreductase [Desulfomicrobiaceae bacterium]|jgi:hypothetical protein|nr:dependent oxidoreductase [Desulfomicrobiaceae bacterium]